MNTTVRRTAWGRAILIASAILVSVGAAISCAPPGALYDFYGGDQSWVIDGVYCGDQPTVLMAVSGPPFWADHTDESSPPLQDPVNDKKGSISFPMMGVANCGTCQWWRIDFVSPDVSGLTYWQDLTAYSAKLADKASVLGNLQVQPLLRVKKADGTITYLRELDSSGNPVFYPISGQWTTCKATVSTAGYTVMNLVVRVFGPCAAPGSGFYEGGVYLDAVTGYK